MAKKKAGVTRRPAGRASRQGKTGPPGPAGPAGPKVTPAEILDLVDGHFREIRWQLDVQLKRIAQMQRQLDEVHSLVKSAVSQLQS